MTTFKLLICFCFVLSTFSYAQDLGAVIKVGNSHYGAVYIGSVGGSGGDYNWKVGQIVSVGTYFRLTQGPTLETLIEYSTHNYSPQSWESNPTNDPRNTVLELTADSRFSILSFSIAHLDLLGGLSLSREHEDMIQWKDSPTSSYERPSRTRTDLSVLAGTGIEFQITSTITIILDGTWRMRYYLTPVAQLGVAYSI